MYHCYPLFLSHPIYFSTHMHMQCWCKITRCAFWALVNTVLRVRWLPTQPMNNGILRISDKHWTVGGGGRSGFLFPNSWKNLKASVLCLGHRSPSLKAGICCGSWVTIFPETGDKRTTREWLQGNLYRDVCCWTLLSILWKRRWNVLAADLTPSWWDE